MSICAFDRRCQHCFNFKIVCVNNLCALFNNRLTRDEDNKIEKSATVEPIRYKIKQKKKFTCHMIGGEGDKKQIYIYIIVFTSQAGSFVLY